MLIPALQRHAHFSCPLAGAQLQGKASKDSLRKLPRRFSTRQRLKVTSKTVRDEPPPRFHSIKGRPELRDSNFRDESLSWKDLPNAVYRRGRNVDPFLVAKNTTHLFLLSEDSESAGSPVANVKMARRSTMPAMDVELLLKRQTADLHKEYFKDPLLKSPTISPLTNVLIQVFIACIGAYLFGFNLSVVNGPLDSIASDLGFAGDAVAKGSVVSTFLVGAFLGAASSSFAADGLGRKRGFMATALSVLLGSSLSAMSTSLPMMLVGRFVVGLGLGLGSPLPTMYISEISPPSLRGTLSGLPQVAACVGILLALGAGVYFPGTPQAWRWCFWVGAAPAALFVFLAESMVESPHWLAQKGKWSAAEKSVELLAGPVDSPEGREALAELKASSKSADAADVPWSALLSEQYRKVFLIGCGIFALQQLSGINAVFFFSSSIFRSAGIESDLVGNLAVGVVNLGASILSTLLMDKAGRKALLFGSFAAMGGSLSLQVLCNLFCSHFPAWHWINPPAALVSTLLFVMAFAMGAGPVPGLLLPEILPTQVRAKGFAVALSVYWILNCVLGFLFLPLLEIFGSMGMSTFFCTMCIVAAAFTHQFVIETKGKTLAEIEAELSPLKSQA